jgi:hypothetical protein
VSVLVAAGIAGWASPAAAARVMPPLIVIPGLGMSALQVNVERDSGAHTSFQFLVPVMTPTRLLPAPATSALDYATRSGLAPQDAGSVPEWLSLMIGDEGRATNMPGVTVKPVSIGSDFGAECPRYVPLADLLQQRGWSIDDTVRCLPYDYRYPPGENTFAADFRDLVTRAVDSAGGAKAVIACHSQGCLMAYHALRTLDPTWVSTHVRVLFGFAGQFSGCSDCLRWAFQRGWSWDPKDVDASPVDPTWAGELALDLQPSVYGDAVLYRNGDRDYRAGDARELLDDAGALSMERATGYYSLAGQDWFRDGDVGRRPLPVPGRFVYGTALPTTVGYAFAEVSPRPQTCTQPGCAGFMAQLKPDVIESNGDGGDSAWMNEAPARWTSDPGCDMRSLPGVNHMDVVTNVDAVNLLVTVATGSNPDGVPCLGG